MSFGRLLGRMLTPYKSLGLFLFKLIVAIARHIPDRVFLTIQPFIEEFGRILYDRRESVKLFVRLKNGGKMCVDISEKTQRQIYTQKIFETGLSRYLIKSLKRGDTFVDIGANVGYFTMLAAQAVGPNGYVIAIEPELINHTSLKNNIALNNYKNITAYDCALGNNDSLGTLNINPLNRGGNSMIPFKNYKSGNENYSYFEIKEKYNTKELYQKVHMRTLDNIITENKILTISFIKIDVEGFEYEVLLGAKHLIEGRVARNIVCELTNKNTRDAIINMFLNSGYMPFHLSFAGEKLPLDANTSFHPRDVLFCLTE